MSLSMQPVEMRPAQAELFSHNFAVAEFRRSVVSDADWFSCWCWLCHEGIKAHAVSRVSGQRFADL